MPTILDDLVVEVRASIAKLSSGLRQAEGEVDSFRREAEKDSTIALNVDGRKVRPALSDAQSAIKQTGQTIRSEMSGAAQSTGVLGGALAGLKSPILALGGAWAAADLGKQFFDAGVKMEALQGKMLAATGSFDSAGKSMAYMRAESERLGLRFTDTADSFSSFAAAATRSGLSLEQVQSIFTGVSEAAVAFRLSNGRIQLVFQALSQMAAKGTVSMEELRQQLGESLPIAMDAAARAMGVTQAEFIKMVEKGDVTAKEFLPRFGQAIRENLGDAVTKSSQSAQANLNRVNNSLDNLKATVAGGGFLMALSESFKAVTEAINTPALKDGLTLLGQILGGIAIIAARVVAGLGIMIQKVVELGKKAVEVNSGVTGGAKSRGITTNPDRPSASALGGKQTSFMPEMMPGNDMTASLDTGTMSDTSLSGAATPRGGFAALGAMPEITQEGMQVALAVRQAFADAVVGIETDKNERLKALDEQYWSDAQTGLEGFLGIRLRSVEDIGNDTVAAQGNSLRTTLQQAAQHNKTFFALEKAAAIARALVSARESVVSAYSFGARLGGPALGATFAAVAAAAQAANIAAIASASYGGSGGGGGGSVASATSSTTSGANQPSDSLGRPIQPATQVYITIEGDDSASIPAIKVRQLIEQINEQQRNGTRVEVYAR